MPNTDSSTTFGSIRISRSSAGEDLYTIEMMRSLMHTLLPEPVEPAMSMCGILPRSAVITLPPVSLPSAMVMGEDAFWNSRLSMISRSTTVTAFLFGISTPTAALPGMGASMRTRGAASASAMSLESTVMRLTRTPGAGCNSKRVITGPTVTLTSFAEMLKLASVSIRSLPVSAGFSSPRP